MAKEMSAAEQTNKYELTAGEVLKMLHLDPNKYIAEKNPSTPAVKDVSAQYKNGQFYEWEIFQKVNGKKGKKIKINPNWATSEGFNKYALSSENGIVIYKPFDLASKLGYKHHTRGLSDIESNGNGTPSDEQFEIAAPGANFEVVGGHGNDEEIIKHLSFLKIQLLKESYESLGVLL